MLKSDFSHLGPLKPGLHSHAPFLHVPLKHTTPWHGSALVWQTDPVNPPTHRHFPSEQVPPFKQVMNLHAATSQRYPSKPSGQMHLPSLQLPPFLHLMREQESNSGVGQRSTTAPSAHWTPSWTCFGREPLTQVTCAQLPPVHVLKTFPSPMQKLLNHGQFFFPSAHATLP